MVGEIHLHYLGREVEHLAGVLLNDVALVVIGCHGHEMAIVVGVRQRKRSLLDGLADLET